jgi:hypothetical protein
VVYCYCYYHQLIPLLLFDVFEAALQDRMLSLSLQRATWRTHWQTQLEMQAQKQEMQEPRSRAVQQQQQEMQQMQDPRSRAVQQPQL